MIGMLHPGRMGAAVGALLVAAGHEVGWAADGRSDGTRQRARDAGLVEHGTVADLLARCDVVLSICPPHAAREVARAAAGYGGTYVDANAVSPATVRAIAAAVPHVVDGGIVGPPPTTAGTTRLYLSGSGAADVAGLFDGTVLGTVVLPGPVGDASALKCAYAAWTKGSAALLVAAREFAARSGVEDALLDEWAQSLPGLADRSADAARRAAEFGWRWSGELAEVGAAFAVVGLPAGFGAAAAEVYRNAGDPGDPHGDPGDPHGDPGDRYRDAGDGQGTMGA